MSSFPGPPFAPDLEDILINGPLKFMPLNHETLPVMRSAMDSIPLVLFGNTPEALISSDPELSLEQASISGPSGAPDLKLAIIKKKTSTAIEPRPCIYYIHGGGMVMGNRLAFANFDWVKQLDVVVVSVEYRLAPDASQPALTDDCYAGLSYISSDPSKFGIDAEKIIICGHSGGGCLAAATALMARDKKGPKLFAQMLIYPMLDDRMITVSSKQYAEKGLWVAAQNVTAWDWILDGKAGSNDVSIYHAPARAEDLSGLPTTFIDCGAAELFRDEDIAYATRLLAHGVQTEMHVWPGAWHGFDLFAAGTPLSTAALNAQRDWLKRLLS
ncbi:alpha/beta hydrolase fold-3 domain-containing protein [Tricladium varicosporioides]|nr:alpha/beta hydrolase fold-3 domain-containing protein [Hymenoscyphus varicosporioides]